jgi:alkylmercury lyase
MDDYTRAANMAAALTRTGGVLDYGPERSRLLVRVLQTLALGRPVTGTDVDALAPEAGMTPDEAQAFVREVTERDGSDRIIGVLGLSLGEHPHRFSVNGQRLSTWCAEDTLFLPALLGQTATVESTSPLSRKPIRLTVGPDGVHAVDPPGAVVSIALVDPDQTAFGSVEAIWMTFCRHIHFFASREEAERWAAGRSDLAILTPDEGCGIGRQLMGRFLARAA